MTSTATPISVTGSKWIRSNTVTINHPYQGIISITFGQETIVTLTDGTTITMENVPAVSDSLLVAGEAFNLVNPADNVTVLGSTTYQNTFLLMSSLYQHVVEKNAAVALGTIVAGCLVVGHSYTIATLGNTDFTLVGASANTVGVTFTSTGLGVGNGTVTAN